MITVVLKPFEGEQPFQTGDILDTTKARLEAQLIAQRRLRPATTDEIALFKRGVRTIAEDDEDEDGDGGGQDDASETAGTRASERATTTRATAAKKATRASAKANTRKK